MNEEKKTDLPEQEAKTAAEETASEEKETKAAEAEAAPEKAEETAAKESADKNAETKDAKNARDGGKKEKHRFRKASAEEEKIEKLEQENAELNDRYLRVCAEYDNFRRRSQKEREALYNDIKADTLSKFLPVYDNLERALKQGTEDEAYRKGVEIPEAGDRGRGLPQGCRDDHEPVQQHDGKAGRDGDREPGTEV